METSALKAPAAPQTFGERGSAPKGGRHFTIIFRSSVKTLLVRCPSVQRQPDGLTIRTNKWFLGARFLGAPPISLNQSNGAEHTNHKRQMGIIRKEG